MPAALVLVVGLTLAARLLAGGAFHLTEDEAYYRLWSMAPAFGYYDHPPMIAWWVWLGRQLAGDTALGVRLVPILASAATTMLVFEIARLVGGGRRDAIRAAVWYNAMPLVAAGGLLAVPDAPAALFWTATLWCALKAVQSRSLAWWAAAGVAAGLATLSKYSALFLAPGVLLWLAWDPTTRKQLATPGPWVAAALAVIIFSGNVFWNADHHWLTFTKQFGRIAPTHFAPGHLADFLAAQLLLINPLIAIFLVRSLTEPRLRATLTPFVATSAPFVAYLLIHSLHDSVQAHWPAPIYPAVAVCAALAAGRMADRPAWTVLRRSTPILGFALYPLLLLILFVPTPITTRLASPVLGWPSFARRLEDERIARGAAWIGALSYGLTAELSDEPAIRAPILQITERDRYMGLGMVAPDISRPGLIVDLYRRIDLAGLRACFGQVTPSATIRRVEPSPLAKSYALFFVSDPRRDVVRSGCRPGT